MGAGVVFGLTYSFFFTSQKAEVFKAKKYLGINDLWYNKYFFYLKKQNECKIIYSQVGHFLNFNYLIFDRPLFNFWKFQANDHSKHLQTVLNLYKVATNVHDTIYLINWQQHQLL